MRVCSLLTRLQFLYRFPLALGLPNIQTPPPPRHSSCRNLHFWQRRHTPRQEVVYKELHLKAAPRMFPFMSSSRRAHMQFLWLVRHRNGLLLKASHAPPSAPQPADKQAAFLPFPFFYFEGVSLFFLGNSRAEMKCA